LGVIVTNTVYACNLFDGYTLRVDYKMRLLFCMKYTFIKKLDANVVQFDQCVASL